jgi:hypothetical protein
MTGDLVISSSIRSRLDDDTISQLRASLHPVDCQTCGERFGPEDEVIVTADDSGIGVVIASLHHSGCRKSEWRRLSGDALRQGSFHVTWRARVVIWGAVGLPVFLVNPSCEVVMLRSSGFWRRRWQFTTHNGFAASGFYRAADPSSLSRLPQKLRAELGADKVRIEVEDGNNSAWSADMNEGVRGLALDRKRIIVGVTSMADPKADDITPEKLAEMTRQGDIIWACAAAGDTPEGKRPGAEDKGRTAAVEAMARRSMSGAAGRTGRAASAGGADDRDSTREPLVASLMLGEVKEDLSPEYGRMLTDPLRKLDTADRITALGMYLLQEARECWIHVMLPDPGTASSYEYGLQRLCSIMFPVTRVTSDSSPARGKITVGTYKEFEAAARRLERALSAANNLKVLGIAIDPAAGFTRGSAPLGFTRYCTRLIEV